MFLSAPKLFMGDKGDEWVSVVGRNAKLLREKFPNVDVDAHGTEAGLGNLI